jgi:2-oxoglutarate ferredoxin oxidoreductase subunit delta
MTSDRVPEQNHEGNPEAGAAAATPVPEAHPKEYDIDIYRAWCKQCGLCAAFCPRGVISLNEEGAPVVDKPERCTGCGWCELHCPDFAISVHEKERERESEATD